MKPLTYWPPPQAQRVLVLAPHPDDEVIGCGGTISLYTSEGTDVRLAIISDAGNTAIRRKETEDASEILGVREVRFLGFTDGEFESHEGEIEEKLGALIEEFSPQVVFAPSPIDHHRDHITTGRVALRLLEKRPGLSLAFYEVYQTIRFTLLVRITDVMEVKERALMKYRQSFLDSPEIFRDAVRGMNKYMSFYARESGYYEAFWVINEAMTMPEVNNWLTYGMMRDEAAAVFLSQLRAVDNLLVEAKRSQERIMALESERDILTAQAEDRGRMIDALKSEISGKTTLLDANAKGLEEARAKIALMERSALWRLAGAFYRKRDALLPYSSRRRKFYDNLVNLIKR